MKPRLQRDKTYSPRPFSKFQHYRSVPIKGILASDDKILSLVLFSSITDFLSIIAHLDNVISSVLCISTGHLGDLLTPYLCDMILCPQFMHLRGHKTL